MGIFDAAYWKNMICFKNVATVSLFHFTISKSFCGKLTSDNSNSNSKVSQKKSSELAICLCQVLYHRSKFGMNIS